MLTFKSRYRKELFCTVMLMTSTQAAKSKETPVDDAPSAIHLFRFSKLATQIDV